MKTLKIMLMDLMPIWDGFLSLLYWLTMALIFVIPIYFLTSVIHDATGLSWDAILGSFAISGISYVVFYEWIKSARNRAKRESE